MIESTAALRISQTLVNPGNQAVANDVVEWEAPFPGRITEVQVALGNIGGTSGQTSVDVKKNGVSILSAVASIAFNAAKKTLRVVPIAGPAGAGEPGGHDFVAGDVFRVDVTAIPGTASANLSVYLAGIAKNT